MNRNQSLFSRGITLVKREYWENKKMILYPLLALVVLMSVLLLWQAIKYHSSGAPPAAHDSSSYNHVAAYIFSANFMLQIVMWVILSFYLVSCLYNDRKDNSILFWQSLPISQTETVISKIIWACLVMPVITLLFMAVNGIIFLALLFFTDPSIGFGSGMYGVFLALLSFCHIYLYQLLIFLPTLGWLLFCSAFAKKLPLLWVVLIPIGIQVTDAIVSNGYLYKHIFGPTYLALINLQAYGIKAGSLSLKLIGLSWVFIAIGACVSLVFIVAAVYLRARSYGKDI